MPTVAPPSSKHAQRVALAALLALAGCSSAEGFAPPPNGMPVLEPVSMRAVGLGYRESTQIQVRYRDESGDPVAGVRVDFQLSAAGGATLSTDRPRTNNAGIASVQLTAGATEAIFQVTAHADGAADLVFDVAVSRLPFLAVDAKVTYSGAGMGRVAHVDALVYNNRTCAQLPPSSMPPAAAVSKGADNTGTIFSFPFLPAMSYAFVGRALDADGRLLAWGCVDMRADLQAGAASVIGVAIPLLPVLPSLAGTYRLAATLPLPPGQLPAWERLTACPAGLAQQILDGISAAIGPGPIQSGIAGARGAIDAQGCRPITLNGSPSLDGAVASLLAGNNPTFAALAASVADLRAITASGAITSQMTLVGSGGAAGASPSSSGQSTWLATHELQRIAFAGVNGAHPANYDPGALGLPISLAGNVPVTADGTTVRIARHGFTLRLPSLWGRALIDVALAPRQLPADPRALLGAVLAGATVGSGDQAKVGCDAVESVVSDRVAVLAGMLAPACEQSLDGIARDLGDAFAAPRGIDFTLGGTGVPGDEEGDLAVDEVSGTLESEVTTGGGRKQTVSLPFHATRSN